jgi:hypothetical protein
MKVIDQAFSLSNAHRRNISQPQENVNGILSRITLKIWDLDEDRAR